MGYMQGREGGNYDPLQPAKTLGASHPEEPHLAGELWQDPARNRFRGSYVYQELLRSNRVYAKTGILGEEGL